MDKGLLFCIHSECDNKSRLLNQVNDMLQHNDQKHKVVNYEQFTSYVRQKYSDQTLSKMQQIVKQEEKLKDLITRSAKQLKEKVEQYQANELKRIPSFKQQLTYIESIKKNEGVKEVNNDLVEKVSKMSSLLLQIDQKTNDLNETISKLLTQQNNYSQELLTATLSKVNWSWSNNYKSNIYSLSKDLKTTQSSCMIQLFNLFTKANFLGWSFVCLNQSMNYKSICQVDLEISEIEKTYSIPKNMRDKTIHANFAIGATHAKARGQKGYDGQDLSLNGHGFYLLRSDGCNQIFQIINAGTCHNSDKEVNWKSDLAFKPEFGNISLIWDPNNSELIVKQEKQEYRFKVDKFHGDNLHFCAHLKGCRAKIME